MVMAAIADLPPAFQERVVCSVTAAAKYEIPAALLLAVAEKEGGQPGQWVSNTNGTHDVGVMQFNTRYLDDLAVYGITPSDVAVAGCYPYDLAAWRLRGHLKNDAGDVWTRAANYHSRTPEYNAPYRADLAVKARKWSAWLGALMGDASAPGLAALPIDRPPSTAAAPAITKKEGGYVPRTITFSSASTD